MLNDMFQMYPMKISVTLFIVLIVFFSNSCAVMTSMGLNNKASWEKPKSSGISPEEALWKKVQSLNTEEAYVDYLSKFPFGKYKYDARLQLQLEGTEAAWDKAKTANSEESYMVFMRDYAGSKYNTQAFASLTKIRQEETWIRTKTLNTAEAYGDFISRFPLSEYVQEAKSSYANAQSEAEWNRIKDFNNVAVFENYVKSFPNSEYKDKAMAKVQALNNNAFSLNDMSIKTPVSPSDNSRVQKNLIRKNESQKVEKPEKKDVGADKWFQANSLNTIEAYQDFLKLFPRHKFSPLAKKELVLLDEQTWMRAKSANTNDAYGNYLKLFPSGRYFKDAKKKMLDEEVATILAGDYQALPAMNKSESISGSKLNEITIKNITGFTLVIIYSGPVSEKIEVKDGSTYVVKLPNGQYNITATLNSDLIGSFVGKESLTGGKYETKFFLGY